MGVIISIVNQKGGVGKTTTAVNISAGLALAGKRVLLFDLDPQGNATSGLGISKKTLKSTAYNVILGEIRPIDAIIKTRYKNLDIIPSTNTLAEAEVKLVNIENKSLQLKKSLITIKDEYDVIIIDCLPSLGVLAINALVASDKIIVPMQCEHYSLEGLAQLLATVKRIKKAGNKNLSMMGIVFTMLDKRLLASNEIMRDIKKNFPSDVIFKTEIPRNVRISESPSHGEPVIFYDKNSKGSEAYIKLTKEILKKLKQMEV
ncbi:MAG: ParA family protein [Clostridiales bacterium]|nr:ParA family protein [Clostridiales bacterium]